MCSSGWGAPWCPWRGQCTPSKYRPSPSSLFKRSSLWLFIVYSSLAGPKLPFYLPQLMCLLQAVYVVSEDSNSGLHTCEEAFYPLSHLPAPDHYLSPPLFLFFLCSFFSAHSLLSLSLTFPLLTSSSSHPPLNLTINNQDLCLARPSWRHWSTTNLLFSISPPSLPPPLFLLSSANSLWMVCLVRLLSLARPTE